MELRITQTGKQAQFVLLSFHLKLEYTSMTLFKLIFFLMLNVITLFLLFSKKLQEMKPSNSTGKAHHQQHIIRSQRLLIFWP